VFVFAFFENRPMSAVRNECCSHFSLFRYRSPFFGKAQLPLPGGSQVSCAYFASRLLQREAGSQCKMMPPLAPNSRCAISIKNMLSNTLTDRIALYVLYIPTASYAHGLSLYLRLYDLHIEYRESARSRLFKPQPSKNWVLVPCTWGFAKFLPNSPRNTFPQIAWAGVAARGYRCWARGP
jgi:hypothetical protein